MIAWLSFYIDVDFSREGKRGKPAKGKENALYSNHIVVKRFCLFELYCREKRK